MKKIIYISLPVVLCVSFACKDKTNGNAITPTYKENSNGTGANPNIGNVTVTGKTEMSDPATENSSLQVGGSGWSYEACVNGGKTLIANLDGTTTKVQLNFSSVPLSGTYTAVMGTPGALQCQMIVKDAPGQPRDIFWYSKTGSVIVTNSGGTISVSYCNVQCLQLNYLFPVLTVCGYQVCA